MGIGRKSYLYGEIMIKFIKRLLCVHEWSPEKEVGRYYDYSGFTVREFECRCKKCGKRKKRKYW